jgi:hypothetical protein
VITVPVTVPRSSRLSHFEWRRHPPDRDRTVQPKCDLPRQRRSVAP